MGGRAGRLGGVRKCLVLGDATVTQLQKDLTSGIFFGVEDEHFWFTAGAEDFILAVSAFLLPCSME